eukprot:TRINITY_DN16954_c1_g1_i3.p1 TRINITY_DN16954_c1_g1~~TRINITY_DN16954_c1_g1_i3.p1  ORF type:complete len:398 (-),score=42.47 TRINITY_DN16954_c1_g1_i3:83-1276(-)
MVQQYGFVPNGCRQYYLNRSQPPLLSRMIISIFDSVDEEFKSAALQSLLSEYQFWMRGLKLVKIQEDTGQIFILNRYSANWYQPRPESYKEDLALVTKSTRTENEQKMMYYNLASAAESGWDFSSRWCNPSDPKDLSQIQTFQTVPVDLNFFLYQMELDISYIAQQIGKTDVYMDFNKNAKNRKKAMQELMWDNAVRCFCDLILPIKHTWQDIELAILFDTSDTLKKNPTQGKQLITLYNQKDVQKQQQMFASNFIPLNNPQIFMDDSQLHACIEAFENSGLICNCGIVTSLCGSGQQWDYPNCWPPIQSLIIDGLQNSNYEKGIQLSQELIKKWLQTNYDGYCKYGYMFEKYNCEEWGESGGGGEYAPQVGFGWTNGVVLDLLDRFGDHLIQPGQR